MKKRRRGKVRVSNALLAEMLFPKGTEVLAVQDDFMMDAVAFHVQGHETLPEVDDAVSAPLVDCIIGPDGPTHFEDADFTRATSIPDDVGPSDIDLARAGKTQREVRSR